MSSLQEHSSRWQHHRAPTFAPVDSDTADLLSLVAEDPHPSVDHEWELFKAALAEAVNEFGTISPNRLRPLVRGKVAPRRIGAFTHRALSQGLVEYTGTYETSDDKEGRNGGKVARVMRWLGEAS